jgi:hypothetical protein
VPQGDHIGIVDVVPLDGLRGIHAVHPAVEAAAEVEDGRGGLLRQGVACPAVEVARTDGGGGRGVAADLETGEVVVEQADRPLGLLVDEQRIVGAALHRLAVQRREHRLLHAGERDLLGVLVRHVRPRPFSAVNDLEVTRTS